MKILITGASGYIGSKLSIILADRGHSVHAVVRSGDSQTRLMHPNIRVFTGDVLDKKSLQVAMEGCEQVYHVAGKAGMWARKTSVFYDVNVEGTRNVLDAALALGVKKMVYTSTCGVIGPSIDQPMEEKDSRNVEFVFDYDISKKMAEDLVAQYVRKGLEVVIVSPAKVYGPGHISHSLMMNAVIHKFLKNRITFIPAPGTFKVSFAFIDDIVKGHILAMEKGKSGERYILGGPNVSYYEFFNRLRMLASFKGFIVKLPKMIIQFLARIQELNHKLWNTNVLFTLKSVDQLFCNNTYSSDKAARELGYTITPLDEALQKTIQYLNHEVKD